jgi:hypothetical protein
MLPISTPVPWAYDQMGRVVDFVPNQTFSTGSGDFGGPLIITGYPYTIACWFNADALADYAMFSQGNYSNDRFHVQVQSDGTVKFLSRASAVNTTVTSVGTVAAGEWHHVVVTGDSSKLYLYIDGKEDPVGGATSGSYPSTMNANCSIGRRTKGATSADYYFNGRIADVRLYNGTAHNGAFALHNYRPDTRWDLYQRPKRTFIILGAAPVSVTPTSAVINLVANTPTLTLGGISVTPTTAAISLTADDATLTLGGVALTPTEASINLTADDATVTTGAVSVTPAEAVMALSAKDPTLTLGAIAVTPPTAAIQLVADTSTVSVGGVSPVEVTPAAAIISLVAGTPTLSLGGVAVTPTEAAMALSANTPTLTLGAIAVTSTGAVIVLTADDSVGMVGEFLDGIDEDYTPPAGGRIFTPPAGGRTFTPPSGGKEFSAKE